MVASIPCDVPIPAVVPGFNQPTRTPGRRQTKFINSLVDTPAEPLG